MPNSALHQALHLDPDDYYDPKWSGYYNYYCHLYRMFTQLGWNQQVQFANQTYHPGHLVELLLNPVRGVGDTSSCRTHLAELIEAGDMDGALMQYIIHTDTTRLNSLQRQQVLDRRWSTIVEHRSN